MDNLVGRRCSKYPSIVVTVDSYGAEVPGGKGVFAAIPRSGNRSRAQSPKEVSGRRREGPAVTALLLPGPIERGVGRPLVGGRDDGAYVAFGQRLLVGGQRRQLHRIAQAEDLALGHADPRRGRCDHESDVGILAGHPRRDGAPLGCGETTVPANFTAALAKVTGSSARSPRRAARGRA
jgi:hypothetical protein